MGGGHDSRARPGGNSSRTSPQAPTDEVGGDCRPRSGPARSCAREEILMRLHRTRPLPSFTCLMLMLAGACLPGARRGPEAPSEQAPVMTSAEAPPPEAPAPQPPPPEPPPEVRSLACVPRPPPVEEELLPPPPAEKAWLMLQLYELPTPSGQGTSLQLRLSSVQNYSCLGYEIPARLNMAPGELRLEVGGVKQRPGPCPAAFGPASGVVVLPETARGTFTLRLLHGKQEDQYRLVIEEDRLELVPLRARFSASQSPLVLLRAPEGALHLQCIFKDWENRCREHAAAGGPTCAQFFADPEIARPGAPGAEGGRVLPRDLQLPPGVLRTSPPGCRGPGPPHLRALPRPEQLLVHRPPHLEGRRVQQPLTGGNRAGCTPPLSRAC